MDNVYLKKNNDWSHMVKYGYVKGNETNLTNRIHDSSEEHPELSTFTYIFKFEKNEKYILYYKEIDKIISHIACDIKKIKIVEDIYGIHLPLLRKLNEYLIKSETKQSNEFICNEGISILLEVLKKEFPLLGLDLIKVYTPEEIKKINNTSKKQYKTKVEEDYHELIKWHEEMRKKKQIHSNIQKKDEYKWYEREYQRLIIEYGYEQLLRIHKLYLELATGGGKSYIVYKLFEKLNPDIIVIFSPRKNINKQNCSSKYLSILKDDYLLYNCSEDKDFDSFKYNCRIQKKKMLIVACPLSNEKVYNMVSDYTNICVWFDEAHNTIENWVNKLDNKYKKYFLEDVNITNRVFTSASPDKNIIEQYPQYFGEIYSPIKVKELIDLKWLCRIKPGGLKYDNKTLNLIDLVIEEFTSTERKFGFSFHSRDTNAFNLFYKHYNIYKKGYTSIKPYLLIDNGGLSDENKQKLVTLDLDYEYRNIKNFEKNKYSMGYVVQQYSMGYDFNNLDYLVFSDPKMSYKDIIQCIGRGIRPDKLGVNERNLNKILNVTLPIYIGDCDEGGYKNIMEVLRYLVLDLDIDILDNFIHRSSSISFNKNYEGVDYEGENNETLLLDLIYQQNILERPTTKILYRFCKKYGIQTEESYNRFKLANPSIPLKNNIYEYNGFKWKNVMDPHGDKYYGEKSEVEMAEDQIVKHIDNEVDLEEFYAEREENGWIALNRYDPKIPPMNIGQLEHYY